MRAPIGGVKNDLITSAVVLFFSFSGICANAVPASQKEQMRRYKEITANTLVSYLSSLPLEVIIVTHQSVITYAPRSPFGRLPRARINYRHIR